MTIAIVDDELETRQYMQGLVAQYLAETGRMAQLVFYPCLLYTSPSPRD